MKKKEVENFGGQNCPWCGCDTYQVGFPQEGEHAGKLHLICSQCHSEEISDKTIEVNHMATKLEHEMFDSWNKNS